MTTTTPSQRLGRIWREELSPWVGLRDGPRVDEGGRTEVEGLYVVGDLAGAPLLKAALREGWELGQRLARELEATAPPEDDFDVLIVGGGPAGIAAALALHRAGRRYLVLEQARTFRTLEAFPRGKPIYAEPRGVETGAPVWFEDAPKEELVRRWRALVHDEGLHVREGITVRDVSPTPDGLRVAADTPDGPAGLVARRVVLAVGRRGAPRRLGIPGEDLPHVADTLVDADDHAGRAVLVVGGGDSAAEAALALARAGARVTLSYRRHRLDRPKPRTREALEALVAEGAVDLALDTRPTALRQGEAELDTADGPRVVPAEAVFVLIGTDPPVDLLKRAGLGLRSESPWTRHAWVLAFVALVWCYYVLKTGRDYLPFSLAPLDAVPAALTVAVPWLPTVDGSPRVLGPGFWGSLVYTLLILGFGVAAMRRHDTPEQRRRYLSLMGFQAVVLFGVPELLAPAVTASADTLYAIGVPWPLRIESLAQPPTHAVWLAVGAFVAFVVVPLYVRYQNERFCSWMCGCGGLAETVGDLWRWRAPRGDLARRAEGAGLLVLLAAVPVTLLLIGDAWRLVGFQTFLDQPVLVEDGRARVVDVDAPEREGAIRIAEASVEDDALLLTLEKLEWDGVWRRTGWTSGILDGEVTRYADKLDEGRYRLPLDTVQHERLVVQASTSALSRPASFARGWYGLVVDFALASVLGVALYPLLGNRIWCRFFCPLRAWMEVMARRFGRLGIVSDDRCISCGECTTWCQMGIDVQGFAEKQLVLDNANSACIQCGVCVEVCPMDVLSLVDKRDAGVGDGLTDVPGPRWG